MKKEKLMTFCDMVFVLVLCFVVLLATMILTSGSSEAQPGNYVISLPRLAATAGSIAFYLIFMLRSSLKSLDDMTEAWENSVKEQTEKCTETLNETLREEIIGEIAREEVVA